MFESMSSLNSIWFREQIQILYITVITGLNDDVIYQNWDWQWIF